MMILGGHTKTFDLDVEIGVGITLLVFDSALRARSLRTRLVNVVFQLCRHKTLPVTHKIEVLLGIDFSRHRFVFFQALVDSHHGQSSRINRQKV